MLAMMVAITISRQMLGYPVCDQNPVLNFIPSLIVLPKNTAIPTLMYMTFKRIKDITLTP